MHILKKLCVMTGVIAALAACTSNPSPEGKPIPALDFSHIAQFPVNVAQVEVVDHYSAQKHPDDMGDMYVITPGRTLDEYLGSRFSARGTRGSLIFEIQDASTFIVHQDAENRVGKWIGVAGFEEYDLTMRVDVRAIDIPGFKERSKVLTAKRRLKISEHASVAERETLQFEALEAMLHDLDYTIERVLRDEFGIALVLPEVR